ncbi:MAG: tRNA uridine-5-carboxymethylaminomethyl(34) synthesis GTPase MnmE [Candidatus Saganbacteria bacterium]|nr:tRNA uridine-5-carboxymethylaminomethyl(34) synthesis GTPase MnmE [Candidatus Saganbacteria bacterium]
MGPDTIAAIATPLGTGGIGVIRISGPLSLIICRKLFPFNKKIQSHRVNHGWINVSRLPAEACLPAGKAKLFHVKQFAKEGGTIRGKNVPRGTFLLDNVLYVYFKSPKSYTGEDVVEISCHGGPVVLGAILDEIVRFGARLAGRGEFTKRAFLNKKLDLVQAEAVLDLIRSRSRMFAEESAQRLRGDLSRRIDALYAAILDIVAQLEASIDFPDDVARPSAKGLSGKLTTIVKQIDRYLAGVEVGRVMREGVKSAIVGGPNVGKSTLLNSLLGEERAIVTHLPGTTRDVIEESVNVDGLVLNIADTAGIRQAKCIIESAGVARSKDQANQAELVLFVLDASRPLSKMEKGLLLRLAEKKSIVILNKIDLVSKRSIDSMAKLILNKYKIPCIKTCLLKGLGVEKLRSKISNVFLGKAGSIGETDVLVSSRQKECLIRAKEALLKSLESIKINMPVDFVTIDLKGAAEAVGEVTGKTVSEKVIDKIFSEFCVGK